MTYNLETAVGDAKAMKLGVTTMNFYNINEVPSIFLEEGIVLDNLNRLGQARDGLFCHTLAVALDFMSKQSFKAGSDDGHKRKFQVKDLTSPGVLINKYHGAGLFQIAAWLKEKANHDGMRIHLVAESREGSTVGVLPQSIDAAVFAPTRVITTLQAQDLPTYCDLVVHYLADPERDMGILWRLGNLQASRKCKALSWNELSEGFEQAHAGTPFRGIGQPEEAQAAWMSYAWQLSIRGWTPEGPKFLFNLLSGNLDLEGLGDVKNLPSLSLNKITLSGDLCVHHQSETGFYFVNGKRITMTHGEAFQLLATHVRELFNQPDSFVEELHGLVKNRREYVDTAMQPVFRRLIRIWPEYTICQTVQEQAHRIVKQYLRSEPKQLKIADADYELAMKHLVHGEESVGQELESITKAYRDVLRICEVQTAVPLPIFLDE